jgi:hypothetical protein
VLRSPNKQTRVLSNVDLFLGRVAASATSATSAPARSAPLCESRLQSQTRPGETEQPLPRRLLRQFTGVPTFNQISHNILDGTFTSSPRSDTFTFTFTQKYLLVLKARPVKDDYTRADNMIGRSRFVYYIYAKSDGTKTSRRLFKTVKLVLYVKPLNP